MKNPFRIDIAENEPMAAWDLAVSIGGFRTKKEAEDAARVMAEFLKGETGWAARAQ